MACLDTIGARVWERAQRCKSNVSASPLPMNVTSLILAIKIWVSPPPIRVLTTQTTLTDLQNIIHKVSTTFPNFWGKKAKATTKVTLRTTETNTFHALYCTSCNFCPFQNIYHFHVTLKEITGIRTMGLCTPDRSVAFSILLQWLGLAGTSASRFGLV